jgi:6,7-dimethyl-8-ribityllumazine synthase
VLIVKVPGTWELPLAVKALIESDKVDAVVALGTILQGATTHADMLASDVSSALMALQMETNAPVAWGILTPENQEQAIERAGMKLGNKGREAALAAIEMVNVLGSLRSR